MAIAKKEKGGGGGAPEWMVTYGDLVTLLLTFFVLLLSMSEMKQDDKLMDFMEAIRDAFGYKGGLQQTPLEDLVHPPKNTPIDRFLTVPIDPRNEGKAEDEGIVGTRDKVRQIRDADRFCVGSPLQFAELSAELPASEEAALASLAANLRGFRTQIEVRGHCNAKPVNGTEFVDHTDLAYARARCVAEALVRSGIDRKRLIIVAAATNEPIATQAYREFERNRNDIVEIVQLSLTVSDVQD